MELQLQSHQKIKMTGYSKAEIMGKDMRFLQGKDRNSSKVKLIKNALEKEEPILVTLKNHKKDGSMFWNELSMSPIKNDAGEVTHHIGIQKDVTEIIATRHKLLKVNKSLKEMSYIDPLTKIPNRRAYDDKIIQEVRAAKRSGKPLSLLMIDIDYFKQYNDTYGHENGDVALIRVANMISATIPRKTDFVARYGGEEFVVILPYTGKDGALLIANNILQSIINLNIEQSPSVSRKLLTVSIGLATTDTGNEHILIDADKALYNAKGNGRNRIEIYDNN